MVRFLCHTSHTGTEKGDSVGAYEQRFVVSRISHVGSFHFHFSAFRALEPMEAISDH